MTSALAGKPVSRSQRFEAASSARHAGGATAWQALCRAAGLVQAMVLGTALGGLIVGLAGCGSTKSFTATEQLLVSDAVDSTVAKIDFRPLSGRKVFLDNSFLPTQKGVPNPNPMLVHSEYVTSSLRQQMLAAGVMLCEKKEEADVIVEARMGALGFDAHSVTYGVPASSTLSTAASTLSGSPMIPLIPELSLAKKEAKSGAAKLALFAYERQSLEPVWQSGIARSSSTARDTWLLGVGPLQNGTIYEGTRFAGSRVLGKRMTELVAHADDEPEALVDYKRSQVFTPLSKSESEVATAQNETAPTDPTASPVTQASAASSAPAATAPASAKPAAGSAPAAAAAPAAAQAPSAAAQSKPSPGQASPAPAAAASQGSASPAAAPAKDSSTTAAGPVPSVKHIDDHPAK